MQKKLPMVFWIPDGVTSFAAPANTPIIRIPLKMLAPNYANITYGSLNVNTTFLFHNCCN